MKRDIGLLTAAAVVTSLLVAVQPPTPAAASSAVASHTSAPLKPVCPQDRPNVVSAAVAARLCGARVLVSGRTTPTTQTWANPDGSLTDEQHLAPVRIRRGDAWVPVDVTLVRATDGSIVPRAHPGGLRLSGAVGAGEHDLVSLGTGVDLVATGWSGALPEPVLDGVTATYPDVFGSVDLVISATRTGYQQVFVVKDRAGLAQVRQISQSLRTPKLTASADASGDVVFTDAAGTVRGRSPAPVMWDSTVDAASLEHVRRGRVGVSVTPRGVGRSELTLVPDAAFLARPDLQFPLYIDPPATLSPAFDAFVQVSWSSDQSAATELKLGTYDGGGDVARSFVKFTTSAIWDQTVLSAKLKLWEWHSWSCVARQWNAYRSPDVSSSVRWTNQPSPYELVGTSSLTTGYNSSCNDGWVDIEVGGALQHAATNHSSAATVMLRSNSETDNLGWKRFNSSEASSGDPYVSITYNSAPAVPSNLAVVPCYTPCGAGAKVSSLRPSLSAKLTDANTSQTLKAEFEVRNASTQATVATSGLLSGSPAWTNGATASWQVSTDLVDGTGYEWRVRGNDTFTYGAWTGWTAFTVDKTKPLVPFVSGSPYAADGQPHGGAGVAGSFTFTPATGDTDVAAFVYTLSSPTATLIPSTTVPVTPMPVTITPPVDGNLTLSVQAKDGAGNLSDPYLHVFKVGSAALAQPLPGANIVRRTKLSVDSVIPQYTRAYFEFRRGPGSTVLAVPSANLTNASGAAITATASSPVTLASLGGYAVWNALDTLGAVGGVVEVRAQLFTDTTGPVFATPWIRVTVDPNADGAAADAVGPGSVNLLTGDYGVSSTDVDEMGLSVGRAASSRAPADGFVAQQERLTANQQQVSTDTTGFNAAGTSSIARVTTRGQGEPVVSGVYDSLEITPVTTTSNDTFAAVGGDVGAMRLSMLAGKTYRFTGWIYVPAASGLVPDYPTRGLRIVAFYRDSGGVYHEFASAKANVVDAWQELSVDLPVASGATEAFFRLYDGMQGGSGKKVDFDHLSMTEIIAPFGPSWNGGATGGPTSAEYTTLVFPQPSLAQLNLAGGGQVTFSLNADSSWTPQPGAEGLVLSKPDANTYRLSETDGTVSDFKLKGVLWTLDSSHTPEQASTTQYVYDTTTSRALLTKVISPVEPGVDDTNSCKAALVKGCEVMEYVYATTTTSGLSQSVFGDYVDHVKHVKIWAWDEAAQAVTSVVVAEYRYDIDGELREVWDPRPAGVNRAVDRPATSSTICNGNESADKAFNASVNGGLSDKWCSSTGPLWLRVDLGASQTISQVVIRHAEAGGESSAYNTRDFSIDVSPDATSWTTVTTVSANTAAVTTHTITATAGRYVRLNITTPTQNGNAAARIYEMEVYTTTSIGSGTPLKTSYDYGTAGRVTSITPPGEKPWMFDYAAPDVDGAALRWDFDENTGTTTADSSGNGRTGTFGTGVGWGQGNDPTRPVDAAATFTMGTGQQVTSTAAVINTNQSFTVAAWVNATDPSNHWRDAVAKDGSVAMGFQLGYDESVSRWGFGMATSDVSNASAHRAQSTTVPVKGAWTHLVGVYDAGAGQMRLYVNGVLQATTAHTSTWNATGTFAVGRAKWNGANVNWWSGGIDDVRAYQKVLTADQIAALATDENPGRLLRVRRAALQQGSPTVEVGTNASTMVYHVPLSTAAGGPYNLDGATAATWGQGDLATDATALFGPEDVPAVSSATPTAPGAAGYPYAAVHYLNPSGREVNTATPGGHIDTVEYDKFANVVRSLQATDREIALGTHPQAATYLADLGLTGSDTATRAAELSTVNTYSSDGVDLLTATGPRSRFVLADGLADPDGAGPLAAIPAGATVLGRTHTINAYDEGKPDGATYHLVTTTTSGVVVSGYPDADARITTYGYNPDNASTSGWVLRKATTVVADAGTGGAALASHVVYDAAGRATSSWGIGSTGSDVRASLTIFYTAGANAADAACGLKPQWAGQPCMTKKAGPATGHDPARMTTNLPERRITSYNRWGDADSVTETVAGTAAARTTTTVFDPAGRISSVAITSTGDGAAALLAISTDYDATTGHVSATHQGSATITREYDVLGRLYRYTDADGGITVNEFDTYGKPAKVSDPTGNATFTYDRAIDPRGLLTSVTDSVAGTFTAGYSPDGQLTTLHYPNGITRTDTLDANLEAVDRVYTRDSDAQTIYRDAVVTNSHGQAVSHDYTGGARTYHYDRVGRLDSTADNVDGVGCTTRTYGFDTDGRSNRTSRTSYDPAGDGTCQTGTASATDSHTYDTADRITDTGYTFDAFGRITTLPGGLTNSFYANDRVAGQVLDTSRQDWTLDPAYRLRAFSTATFDGTTWNQTASRVNHYGDDSDSPRWIVEDTGSGALTRLVSGPDGTLAATTTTAAGSAAYQIVSLHGDVVTTTDATAMPAAFLAFDEFGVPTSGQAATRYGWLGGKQRSAEALGSVILMGVRLYHTDIGRFLQPDPVDGGSATAYDYANADPVNSFDLDGTWPNWGSVLKVVAVVAVVASVASVIPGPIGMVASGVAAVSYAATGNWKEAALAVAGIGLAAVGAGAAVLAYKAAKTATVVGKVVAGAAKLAGRAGAIADRFGSVGRSAVSALGRGAVRMAASIGRGVAKVGRAAAAVGRGIKAIGRLAWGGMKSSIRAIGRAIGSAGRWAYTEGTSRMIAGNNCGQHFQNSRIGGSYAYLFGFAVGFVRNRACL